MEIRNATTAGRGEAEVARRDRPMLCRSSPWRFACTIITERLDFGVLGITEFANKASVCSFDH
jgi:hypothetical protein